MISCHIVAHRSKGMCVVSINGWQLPHNPDLVHKYPHCKAAIDCFCFMLVQRGTVKPWISNTWAGREALFTDSFWMIDLILQTIKNYNAMEFLCVCLHVRVRVRVCACVWWGFFKWIIKFFPTAFSSANLKPISELRFFVSATHTRRRRSRSYRIIRVWLTYSTGSYKLPGSSKKQKREKQNQRISDNAADATKSS